MDNFNVKTGKMFHLLQHVSLPLIHPVLDFLEEDLTNFKKDNKTRGGFFDGSTFIRFPNATFVDDSAIYDYLYNTNFCGIKSFPKRHRLEQWDLLCDIVSPLIAFMKSQLTEECEPIGAEINVLPPGVNILPHVDRHPLLNETYRVHIVLCTNEKTFMIGDLIPTHWPQGSCFIFDNTIRHGVENNGSSPRAHLVVDFLPVRYLEYINNAHIL
jgi:hypothetical protein